MLSNTLFCLSTFPFLLPDIIDDILPGMGHTMTSGSYEPILYMVLKLKIEELKSCVPHPLHGHPVEEGCPLLTLKERREDRKRAE